MRELFPTAVLTLIGLMVVIVYAFAAAGGLEPTTLQFRIVSGIVATLTTAATACGLLTLLYRRGFIEPKPHAKHIVHV